MRSLQVKKQFTSSNCKVSDATVKDLVNEIMNDSDIDGFEKKDQLLKVIEQNDLNSNQTEKINRIIDNMSSNGSTYGQALLDAESMCDME